MALSSRDRTEHAITIDAYFHFMPRYSTEAYLIGLEDDLLDLHVVKKVIALSCVAERHDLVEHESASGQRDVA